MRYLNDAQIAQLLRPINDRRVKKDGKNHSHLQQQDVRAHLTRIFGFGRWSLETPVMELVYERNSGDDAKPRWCVCYRAQCKLEICAPDGTFLARYSEWSTGEAINQPSLGDAHDLALKAAESGALKRCTINLGSQFGLSLYNGGSLAEIIGRTLVGSTIEHSAEHVEAVEAGTPEIVPESEVAPAPEDHHEQSAPPVKASADDTTNSDARELRVKDLTVQLLGATRKAEVAGLAGQVMKEGLTNALTDDGQDNVLTLGALVDATLKRVAVRAAS